MDERRYSSTDKLLYMAAVGQHHYARAPDAFPQGKELTGQGAGLAYERNWMQWGEDEYQSLAGNRILAIQSVVKSIH
jgi:hypothetical protein